MTPLSGDDGGWSAGVRPRRAGGLASQACAPATNPSCPQPRIPGVRPWWRREEQTREPGPAPSRQRPGAARDPDQGGDPPSAGARSPGRWGFLFGVGGLAAAALVGPGGGWLGSEPTTSGSASSTQPRNGGSGFGLDLEARRARALQLRLTTAQQQLGDPFPQPAPNGDEGRYEVVGVANFTKALPHNNLGEVDPGVSGAAAGPWQRPLPGLSADPAGRPGQADQPEGAFSFELQGPDPWQRPLPAPPALTARRSPGSWPSATGSPWPATSPTTATAKSQSPPPPSPSCAASPTTKTSTPARCSAPPTPSCPG